MKHSEYVAYFEVDRHLHFMAENAEIIRMNDICFNFESFQSGEIYSSFAPRNILFEVFLWGTFF